MFFIFQVIFGELFQLPAPPHIDVMYTTLLIELCKLQPGSLPQVVSLIVCVPAVCVNDFPTRPEMFHLSIRICYSYGFKVLSRVFKQ